MSEHRINRPRTALVLSGGGSRGAYEMGVWKALRQMGIKIDIVTGTSIGSMNAALVAQDGFRTGFDLWETMETGMVFDYEHIVENRGVRFTGIKDLLDGKLSEPKIRASEMDFGIVTVRFPSMEPVRLWKEDIPDGELMDYIFASCSCFPVVAPYEIEHEKFVDGGFRDYIPIGMALEKGAERIIAVDLNGFGKTNEADLAAAGDRLILIRSAWDLGAFPVFEPSKAKRLIHIGYLDTLRTFGVFDGSRYTFIKGEVNLRNLKAAEEAAFVFDLDPRIIYSKEHFLCALSGAIADYRDGDDPEAVELRRMMEDIRKTKLTLSILTGSFTKMRSLGQKGAMLLLCDLLKRAGYASSDSTPVEEMRKPLFPIPKSARKILGSALPAALWLVKHDFA